ncbi:MAG: hypothetical protein WA882_08215 [Geitlerinemataceae cyanobacterium]
MKFPIFLFLVVLIFFALVGQNLSQSLPLMFLGIKSIALPVGVWVALALAAGAVTAGVISLLFPRSNSTRTSKTGKRRSSVTPPPPGDPELGSETSSSRVAPENFYTQPSKAFEGTEDLQVEYARVTPSPIRDPARASQPSGEEVWDDEEWESTEPPDSAVETPQPTEEENRRVVEIRKDPIAGENQGSIYSYTYRSPEDVRISNPEFADDLEDDETLDLRDLSPERPIDPFPQIEIIDPIVEPESPVANRDRTATPKEDRSPPAPQSQNPAEDDWGESPNNKNEDW